MSLTIIIEVFFINGLVSCICNLIRRHKDVLAPVGITSFVCLIGITKLVLSFVILEDGGTELELAVLIMSWQSGSVKLTMPKGYGKSENLISICKLQLGLMSPCLRKSAHPLIYYSLLSTVSIFTPGFYTGLDFSHLLTFGKMLTFVWHTEVVHCIDDIQKLSIVVK